MALPNHLKTHCPQDHPYDAANTEYNATNGARQCRRCRAERRKATREVASRGVPEQVEEDAWREQAACQYEEGDAWFADKRNSEAVAHALAVCAGCPVRAACADYADRTRQPWGIWGGVTADQRGTAYRIKYSRL